MKQVKNFDDYKFRASAVGNLMVGIKSGRTKPGNLSKTTQTYLKKLFIEEVFGKKKEIHTKQINKGIFVEEKSITLYSEITGRLFFKNEKRYENDYTTGTPDMVKDIVPDIKSSWDIYTFPMFDEKLKNDLYYWQDLTYQWMTGVHRGEIAYCLVDTPEHIILDEIRRYMWNNNILDISDEQEQEIRNNLTFSNIPKELRVKRFPVEWNEDDIELLKIQIITSRGYLNNLLKSIKQ